MPCPPRYPNGGTAPVTPNVTWNTAYSFNCDSPYENGGITATLTAGIGGGKATWSSQRGLELKSGVDYYDTYYPSTLTFSYNSGNITKIEITYDNNSTGLIPSGWSDDGSKLTWNGTASSVTIMSPDNTDQQGIRLNIRKVEFYVE